jgi:dTDP-4-amino-4,6-dideoxygalactose transaminase
MDEWHALCEQNGLVLVEDCAQAHLAKWSGRVAGSFGVAGAHSFYPTKNLGALGDGGAIVTNDDKVNEDARRLRNYGQSVRYHHPEFGLNSRLDELQAAVLTERLAYLKEFTNRRQDIATKYNVEITNAHVRILAMPVARENHVYHLYVVCSPFRDALQRHLRESGVESLIHYPIPVYKQPGLYKASLKLPGSAGASTLESVSQADLANEFRFCEEHTASCVTLPCHPFLSDAEVRVVIEAVNSFTPD